MPRYGKDIETRKFLTYTSMTERKIIHFVHWFHIIKTFIKLIVALLFSDEVEKDLAHNVLLVMSKEMDLLQNVM